MKNWLKIWSKLTFSGFRKSYEKRKRQTTDWKEILTSDIYDKVSRLYKGLLQLNRNSKQHNLLKGENLNRHSTKEDTRVVNKHMKRRSLLLVISQVRTTMKSHFIHTRMTIIIRRKTEYQVLARTWRNWNLIYADKNVKWHSHLG